MNYLLLTASILLETAKALMLTKFSKDSLTANGDIYKFNTFMYMGSLAVILLGGIGQVSLYSVIMAFFFAVVTMGTQIFFLMALTCGPMSFTAFLQGAGLVFPVLAGIVFMGDRLAVHQIIAFPILIIALALVFNISREVLSARWTVFASLSMVCMGLVGIIQMYHQNSPHRNELGGFLFFSFVYAILLNFILWRVEARKRCRTFPLSGKNLTLCLLSGVFMGIVNLVNLYLAGVMPKIVFFPASNGGLTIVTMLGSVIFFKERLKGKQWVGIVVCLAALCVLGL